MASVARLSAGLLVYRLQGGRPEVFLVHPGGPLWAKKDLGAWSIPKGEVPDGADPLAHALVELREETGCRVDGRFTALTPVKQKGGKTVQAWAIAGDCDAAHIVSNTFEMEWPPKSGKTRQFPEVDRAGWFDLDTARQKLNPAQVDFIDQLERMLQR